MDYRRKERAFMNALERFIQLSGDDENLVMDLLQNSGIISDNCIHPCDIAEEDCEKAIEFFTGKPKKQHERRD